MPLSVRFESVISRALEREVHVSNLQILGEMAREVTVARITMLYSNQKRLSDVQLFSFQVGVEGEEELVAVLEFYTGLGLIAYWGRFLENV